MNRSEPQLLSHVKASLVAGAYRRIPVPAHGSVSRVRICSARRARRGRTDRRDTVRSVSPRWETRKTGLALIVVAASDRVWAECFGLEVVIWPLSTGSSPTSGLFSPPMGDFNPCDWLLIPPRVRVWCGDFQVFACSLCLLQLQTGVFIHAQEVKCELKSNDGVSLQHLSANKYTNQLPKRLIARKSVHNCFTSL